MNQIRHMAFIFALCGISGIAAAAHALQEGTEVKLKFDQPLDSKTAKAGDRVFFHVARPVYVNGDEVIPSGMIVKGVVATVSQKDRFGKNARLRITLDPIWIHGKEVDLQPRDKGKEVGGTRSDMAAAASGGGLLVLGPLGLAAGYFVVGHSVHIKKGDNLRTEVAKTVWLR